MTFPCRAGRISRLFLLLVLLAGCAVGPHGRPPVRVYIVAGQSNAVGYNHTRDYRGGRFPFPEDLRVQPSTLFWAGQGEEAVLATSRWTTLRVGESGAFGPEIMLSHDLQAAMPRESLAIVKFAVGGSGIARSTDYDDYIPALAHYDDHGGNWHPPTDGRPAGQHYRALLANVRAATAALERDGYRWRLAGFVWMQGEHEAGISPRMARDYASLLGGFMKSVRKDLDAPGLVFAVGGVNGHTWAFGDEGRRSQAEACRADPHAVLVPTLDLPRNRGEGGPAHFDADGMLSLGSRFARALLGLKPAPEAANVGTAR